MPITRQGQFIGSYGLGASGVITFDWEPSPLVFSEAILQVKDSLEDRTVPLILSQQILQHDIEENFEGEHDPEGQPWAPWSSSYEYEDPATNRTRKIRGYAENLPAGHSGKILNWRGILKEAATSDAAFVQVSGQTINDDSLFFDTGDLPPYWVYHQQPEVLGDKIPQRRFLGMSGEAEIQILETFDEWFQGIIELAVSKNGRIFSRRRDPATGRFMAKA